MGTATEQRVPPAPPLPVPRLDALTGLRALAAGLVFFHHTFSPSIVPGSLVRLPGTGWLRSLADTGVTGVTFFFVLSGFVLAWSWDDTRTTAGFYARRFARVWPLHAVVLVLATVAVLPLLGRPGAPVAGTLAALALVQS
ncbi:MAG: acyltransferase family protein, partial [Mycobacteriales bacterium]